MQVQTQYLLASIPLAVAALAWSLNQLSFLFTTRLADRRILKETLYFLLELRHLVAGAAKQRDFGVFKPVFMKAMQQHVPGFELSAAELLHLDDLIKEALSPLLASSNEEVEALQDGYNDSLLKLASVDPFSAYRLRGKDTVLALVGKMSEQAQATMMQNTTVQADPERQQKTLQLMGLVQPQTEKLMFEEIVADVEEVMWDIARRLGREERRELKTLLVEKDEETDKRIEQLMNGIVNSLVQTIKQQYDTQTKTSAP